MIVNFCRWIVCSSNAGCRDGYSGGGRKRRVEELWKLPTMTAEDQEPIVDSWQPRVAFAFTSGLLGRAAGGGWAGAPLWPDSCSSAA